MKFVRILGLLAIVGTGAYLAIQNNEAGTPNVEYATNEAGEVIEVVVEAEPSVFARGWANIKKSLSGSGKSSDEVVAEVEPQTATKDHGRLKGLFKSAPQTTATN